jgi:uncharacterized protein (TIGR02246 family)
MTRWIAALSVALVALAATTPADLDAGPDLRSAIDAVEEAMHAAFQRSDAAAFADFYTDDAEMIGTSGQIIQGRSAILRHAHELLALGISNMFLQDREVFEGDHYGVETGRATFVDASGTRVAAVRYMTLWKETIDGWKIHRDLAAPVAVGPEPGSGGAGPATFRLRESEPFHAVVLPLTGPYSRSGEALGRLIVELATQEIEPLGAAFGRYYDDEGEVPPTELRFEVGFPVAEGTTAAPPLEVREIDDGTIVWAVVGGPHEAADRPWAELEEWARSHGYSGDGPAMETWLDGPRTEMRMAVRRID